MSHMIVILWGDIEFPQPII